MDAQFWIYIIIGIIYFLSRMLKKPEETSGGAPDGQHHNPGSEQTAEKPRPMTFEELLREITEGKQAPRAEPEPKPAPQFRPSPRYEPEERTTGEEARSMEKVDIDETENARIFQRYEEAQSLANQRTSLEESLRLEDTVVDFGRFAAFEKKAQRNVLQDYLKIMQNPETLKQAVVMSEILNRSFSTRNFDFLS